MTAVTTLKAERNVIEEESWQTGVRRELQGRFWQPIGRRPLGAVVIVHGLGEHSHRYRPLAESLAAGGWGTFAADLPGHGLSPGRRGHIASYREMLREIGEMTASAQRRCPDLPIVLLGHSMGANLVTNYALRREEIAPSAVTPSGMVLSAPMFLPTKPPPRPKIFAAWLTGRLVPWLTIRAPVNAKSLTKNEAVIDDLRNDPLVHNRLSLYLATQLLAQGRHALDHADQIDLPTLLLHGEADPITNYRASESFAMRLGDRATYESFPGMLHEVFHEPGRDAVIGKLLDWLRRFEEQP